LVLASVGGEIVQALSFAFGMFWEILWALILGFALSGAVQAVVSKGEMRRLMPDDSPVGFANWGGRVRWVFGRCGAAPGQPVGGFGVTRAGGCCGQVRGASRCATSSIGRMYSPRFRS